jgi:hypothetical protein
MSQDVDRRTFCFMLTASLVSARAGASNGNGLTFYCSPKNDLYQALIAGGGQFSRHSSPSDAIAGAKPGSGVMLLADGYPNQTLVVPEKLMKQAAAKNLRIYIEYSASHATGETKPVFAEWRRAVVASSFFGKSLPALRILSVHQSQYLVTEPAANNKTHLVLARIAGFDTAVFGIPEKDSHALLFEDETGHILTATTQLSRSITARFAPSAAWITVWQAILSWLTDTESHLVLKEPPSVRPTYPAMVGLPGEAERSAFSRGVKWYRNAHLYIHPSWAQKLDESAQYPDRVGPAPSRALPMGDGSLGILEGHNSRIFPDGSQKMRWYIRADCVGETSMVLSLAAQISGRPEQRRVALNLIDFLVRSRMATGSRMNPESPSYGLIGWNEAPKYHDGEDGYDVYYGDDNARCLLGVLATMATTGESRWQERFWLAVFGNFRLLGVNGFQPARVDQKPLQANGWKHYFQANTVLHDLNYEAYPWALFLWAYGKTGYRPFLDRVLKGVSLTMEAYPRQWRWTGSFTAQQARILLPLAWMVRVHDTPETRSWLDRVVTDLLDRQHSSGAIRERTGDRATGIQMPPASNEEYGKSEGPLIQNNGDPVSDLLYTMNFAFIGLHEAYAATGNRQYKDAEDRIADFLVRAQVHSEIHPEFDGAWYRAFDFDKWDYWASNSDAGWGAWCTESGWSQSWISTVFALRLMKRSLWDVVSVVPKYKAFDRLQKSMLTL